MRIISSGITNGKIDDRFGKKGDQFNEYGIPSRSLPISVKDAPAGTASFSLILEDKNAAPVCGFVWIHWIAANITSADIPENASLTDDAMVQGTNSWYGQYGRMGSYGYGGMAPPDRPHTYELHIFALDDILEIYNGFFINELYEQMEGHVLDHAVIKGSYPSR